MPSGLGECLELRFLLFGVHCETRCVHIGSTKVMNKSTAAQRGGFSRRAREIYSVEIP